MKDLFGKALLDYQNGNYSEDIITSTNISDDDLLPLPYLFRVYKDMPELEQKALSESKGNVLDVGCGSGSHSLYLQQKGLNVKAIDISRGAIEVARIRGVAKAEVKNILDEIETFDTILLLMNGTGIFQEIRKVSEYLGHLKSLLKPGGQVLIDSSDIRYMYEDQEDDLWQNLNSKYYGELDYFITYKGEKEYPITWLYLDYNTLKTACTSVGFDCELVIEGAHYDYLARLS